MIHIENVPHHIKELAAHLKEVLTDVIKKDLESGTVKTAEQYLSTIIPEIDPLYKSSLELVNKAIETCTKIQDFDWTGAEVRLSLLIGQLTHLKDEKKHGIGKYITWCQIVIDWIIGKS
jgi:hypothetical protein